MIDEKQQGLFERMILTFAPELAARRARARVDYTRNTMALTALRKYDAAALGRRTDGWKSSGNSANSEIRLALTRLRDRSHELIRNNMLASRAIDVVSRAVVGHGIVPEITGRTQRGQKAAREIWKLWAGTSACDADGLHNMDGLQELAMRTIVSSGEVLIRRRRRRSEDRLPVPLQLQVLEPHFLDHSRDGEQNDGSLIIQGVQFDALGRRTGYWLFDRHPGEALAVLRRTPQSRFVPASEILHVFRVDRPGQVRGVPWLAPAMIRLRDRDEMNDAYMLRQRIAACFTAFIYDSSPPEGSANSTAVTEKIEPGAMEVLPPGKDIKFATPPGVDGISEFSRDQAHEIAAAIGITYESLTTDLRQVNFLSGRMGRLDMNRNIDSWRWNMFIPRLCGGVFSWFMEALALEGVAEPLIAEWTPPPFEMLDPSKEVPYQRDRVRTGMIPWSEMVREQGYDPQWMLDRMTEDNAAFDERGLVLDSDPRKISRPGQLQQQKPDEGQDSDSETTGEDAEEDNE